MRSTEFKHSKWTMYKLPMSAAGQTFVTVLDLACNALGDSSTPQIQRSVGRLLEGLGSIIPDKAVQEEFVNYMRTSSPYPHLRSQEKFQEWLQPVKAILTKSATSTVSTASTFGISGTFSTPSMPSMPSTTTSFFGAAPTPAPAPNPWFRQETKESPIASEENFATIITTRFIPKGTAANTQGTPASYRLGVNRKHTKALQRLEESARKYRGVAHN